MKVSGNVDKIIHRWLRIPYRLHVRVDKKIGRAKRTVVFVHGIGGNGDVWKETLRRIEVTDTRVIVVDLIGFGKSPKPAWAKYSTAFQAKSLRATLLRIGVLGKVTIVGHSMGSLVAIETARRYPLLVKRLILCSPPLYSQTNGLLSPDRTLRRLFQKIRHSPDRFIELAKLAKKYRLVNKTFNVSAKNFNEFVNALEAGVIEQTALRDVEKMKIPVEIVHGVSDPVVPALNLFALARANKNIHVQTILAGHEILGSYVRPLIKTINRLLSS